MGSVVGVVCVLCFRYQNIFIMLRGEIVIKSTNNYSVWGIKKHVL